MRARITSLSNPKIKTVVKLREGKQRRRTGLFLLDGLREIDRAVQCGVEIVEIFIEENNLLPTISVGALNENLMQPVSPEVFEKIAFGDRHEGILAVARQPERSLKRFATEIDAVGMPLLAVLEKTEKPGNIGAIFRSADGAGLNGVLLADSLTDFFSPNVIRNSMGTVFHMPAAAVSTAESLGFLRQTGIRMAVARCDGAIPYTEYDFRRPTAIVLGNEADGLSNLWTGEGVTAISIPMLGIADSLNVSVAAAVLFFEARRQRQGLRPKSANGI